MSAWRDKEEFKARVLRMGRQAGRQRPLAYRPPDAQQVGILLDRRQPQLQRRAARLRPRRRATTSSSTSCCISSFRTTASCGRA